VGSRRANARNGLALAVVNDTLYAIGGAPNFILTTNINEQYTPFGYGTIPPTVFITLPQNTVYNESSVPLSFTVERQITWAGYSLDGQDNVTITGNTTMSGLTDGAHDVTVYARDEFDNAGASETACFTVKTLEPFPTLPVAASVASVTLIGAGVLIYFRKRKRTRTS
jgi:hypothetical protein